MKKIITLLFAIIFLFGVVVANAETTPAEKMLGGWAWSSNIGWISFNCENTNCASSYKVKVLPNNTLSGYAYSSNIGWIQFGNLSSFPTGPGTKYENASIVSPDVTGWFRALSYGGGWDGWVSLKGDGYGVKISGNDLSGFAWGGDVVGWISFKGPGYGVFIKSNNALTDEVVPPGSCRDESGAIILDGETRTYYKEALVPVGATCDGLPRKCQAGTLGGNPDYRFSTCNVDVPFVPPPLPPQVTLSLVSAGGSNFATGTVLIKKGTAVDVKWQVAGGRSLPESCTTEVNLSGNDALINDSITGGTLSGVINMSQLTESKTYRMTCRNSAGETSSTVKATIVNFQEQ